MSKFVQITAVDDKKYWLNVANIVSISECEHRRDHIIITTNSIDEGDADYYIVPGSPEELLKALGVEVVEFR